MPKDIKFLSKRRRNQILQKLQNNKYFDSIISNISSNIIEETANTSVKSHSICTSNLLVADINKENELLVELQYNNNELENTEEHILETKHNMSPLIDISSYNNEQSLGVDLQTFIIEHNIPHNSANELLRILRKYGHAELPNDVRTLVHTPRNVSAKIKCMGDGHYAHFGLTSGLERSIRIYSKFIKTNEIKINVNIDGLPLRKVLVANSGP